MKKPFLLALIFVLPVIAFDFPADFPKTQLVFEKKLPLAIVDCDMDTTGRLYVLTESIDSLTVWVIEQSGDISRSMSCDKGPTPKPWAAHIEVSRGGEIALIWGVDTEIKTPINWVFDDSGKDILPPDNVLKYAEWLQVSPSGNFFTCQGYHGLSGIPDVYRRDWTPVKWEHRLLHHGYFVGSDGDEDLLLFTESDTGGTGLALAKLPSKKDIFIRHLPPNRSYLLPHRGRMAASKHLFAMRYPENLGGTTYGVSPVDGSIEWTTDHAMLAIDMAFSDDGRYIAILGGPSTRVLDSLGRELAFDTHFTPHGLPYAPGIPDIEFFGDIKTIITSLYLPGYDGEEKSTIIRFDEDWNTSGPTTYLSRIEGFETNGNKLVVRSDGGDLSVYRILSK